MLSRYSVYCPNTVCLFLFFQSLVWFLDESTVIIFFLGPIFFPLGWVSPGWLQLRLTCSERGVKSLVSKYKGYKVEHAFLASSQTSSSAGPGVINTNKKQKKNSCNIKARKKHSQVGMVAGVLRRHPLAVRLLRRVHGAVARDDDPRPDVALLISQG